MAQTIGKLTALRVARLNAPGMYGDGGGLYLQITGAGAKSWIFRFTMAGKSREMGLGSFSAVPLIDARALAAACRAQKQAGVDPIDARKGEREAAALAAAQAITFKEAATRFIEANKAGWKNPKHAAQWTATLEAYAYPVLGAAAVQSIDTTLVLKVIEPIWATKTETASRVRGRIERVLDWAKVRGYRTGENPARWRGHLDKLLPKSSKVRRVRHHPALPYGELPAFIAALREQSGVAARALEFTILTAARTGETIGATWPEVSFAEKAWTIPPGRMKAGKEHRVPLSARAVAILTEMDAGRTCEFVFPGGRLNRGLSNMAMDALLNRMRYGHVTVHGFRSTFRDWAAECSSFSSEVVEMALAHAISNKVEAAYRRGALFEKRRRLAAAWEAFCQAPATGAGNRVVAIRAN